MEHIPQVYLVQLCCVDDLCQARCVHEQKAHCLQWARSMGMTTMANQNMLAIHDRD